MTVDQRREFSLDGSIARVHVIAHSDRGAVRAINEDSFFADGRVFAVADGMGGHAFGDRASQTAVSVFRETFEFGGPAEPQQIVDALVRANAAVIELSDGDAASLSGTTITGIALVGLGPSDNHHWMAFNVGDSRTYTWDGRTLGQVSVDHSAVQELIDLGEITRSEAERHPQRNVVTRALGAAIDVEPDIWLFPARGRQVFLLCSDGLTKELADDEIARIIVFHDAEALRVPDALPLTLAERLVNAAIAAGGSDNVTVVVVECEIVGTGVSDPGEDTIDRFGLGGVLEDTRPRA